MAVGICKGDAEAFDRAFRSKLTSNVSSPLPRWITVIHAPQSLDTSAVIAPSLASAQPDPIDRPGHGLTSMVGPESQSVTSNRMEMPNAGEGGRQENHANATQAHDGTQLGRVTRSGLQPQTDMSATDDIPSAASIVGKGTASNVPVVHQRSTSLSKPPRRTHRASTEKPDKPPKPSPKNMLTIPPGTEQTKEKSNIVSTLNKSDKHEVALTTSAVDAPPQKYVETKYGTGTKPDARQAATADKSRVLPRSSSTQPEIEPVVSPRASATKILPVSEKEQQPPPQVASQQLVQTTPSIASRAGRQCESRHSEMRTLPN